jgi:sarcosine oxidase
MSVDIVTPHAVQSDDLSHTSDLLVVGAGIMGVWTAYWAKRGGRHGSGVDRSVTLLDAWGAGNPRATSGDETRLLHNSHASDHLYQSFSRTAREHWIQFSEEWGIRLFVQSGILFFAHRADSWERTSARELAGDGVPCEMLSPEEISHLWPQIGLSDDLCFATFEPEGGILMARQACQAVTGAFQKCGGIYAIAAVRPSAHDKGRLLSVADSFGRTWAAETFVFACGPWLPSLFPSELTGFIRVTKQDVIFIGAPEGDKSFSAERLPGWVDQDAYYYGVPSVDHRGIKVGVNRFGPVFDPSNGERIIDPDSVHLVRKYLRVRFPGLADRPVVETKVCQYETTADETFLIDRHPRFENVWLVGGGSGRGFKHGPRIGEYVLSRIDGVPEGAQHGEDEQRFRLAPRTKRFDIDTGLGDGISSRWSPF